MCRRGCEAHVLLLSCADEALARTLGPQSAHAAQCPRSAVSCWMREASAACAGPGAPADVPGPVSIYNDMELRPGSGVNRLMKPFSVIVCGAVLVGCVACSDRQGELSKATDLDVDTAEGREHGARRIEKKLHALALLTPFDVLNPPLCGNNGPEYDRRVEQEHAAFEAALREVLLEPDAGRVALGIFIRLPDTDPRAFKPDGSKPSPEGVPYAERQAAHELHTQTIQRHYALGRVIAVTRPEGCEGVVLSQLRDALLGEELPWMQPCLYSQAYRNIWLLSELQSEEAYAGLLALEESLADGGFWHRMVSDTILRMNAVEHSEPGANGQLPSDPDGSSLGE